MTGFEMMMIGVALGIVIALIGFMASLAGRIGDVERDVARINDSDVRVYVPAREHSSLGRSSEELIQILRGMKLGMSATEKEAIDQLILMLRGEEE